MNVLAPERIGCITASRIGEMMAGGKGISRARYAGQLAAERMTGKPHRHNFTSAAIEHGNKFEPIVRMKYEIANQVMVEGTGKGFVLHPFIKLSGCSPDGLVGDDGLVEIKNPETHTFLAYMNSGEIPLDYRYQMLWQLACTRRKWCDWVAHDPDLPDYIGFLQVRFEPTAAQISEIERDVRFFNAEIEQLIKTSYEKRRSPCQK